MERFSHHRGVRAAQDRLRRIQRHDLRLDLVEALQSERSVQQFEPLVRLVGHSLAEAEALAERESVVRMEPAHCILRAPPGIDLLSSVTNHDYLCILPLDNSFDHWVGVLCLVEQDEVAGKGWVAQRPQLEIHVVLKAQTPILTDQVVPCLEGIWSDNLGKLVEELLRTGYKWNVS